MLADPDIANLIILTLAAPIIWGAAWTWMRNHARRDEIQRWPR